MSTAIELVAVECERNRTKEGWTEAHDDKHVKGELALAAACYALPRAPQRNFFAVFDILWPWDLCWWKPTPSNRIRELVKAGALVIAEIERLQRAEEKGKS